MRARKERIHCTGTSNRAKDWQATEGPIDFDASMRATLPRKMDFKTDTHVPIVTSSGAGNVDFSPTCPGQTFRQPNADPQETLRKSREAKALAESAASLDRTAPPGKVATITAMRKDGTRVDDQPREPRQKGHKPAPRWNPKHWHEDPAHERAPLQKEEGRVWNHAESHKVQGDIKGQDRLMRSVRRPEDVATPESDSGHARHPLTYDNEEYYPGRGLIDAVGEEPGNDFQVRPVNLPDFFNPPPEGGDAVTRMQRLREVVRQRYAGRPRLMGVFRNCALTKPGFVFPKDLMQVFDQMGIRVGERECELLVQAVDKDGKGAATFEEFSDLIYGGRVNVGGPGHEPQERHVRHVTKTLVDSLLQNGNKLGKAFCELDPERRYVVSKQQFANALGTACNHISSQAIDFLWSAQFPGEAAQSADERCIDWRSFMSQLAHFAHEHRAPTPCCVQGRKRQYDLLQRTAAITGGSLTDVDLNRPDQDADDNVTIVADRLVHRQNRLPHRPRDAALLTEHFVENIRSKASRVERALPQRIPKDRLRELLRNRRMVHQDELVDLLVGELDGPSSQEALPPQEPLYAAAMRAQAGAADVLSLEADAGAPAYGEWGGGGGGGAAAQDLPPRQERPHSDAALGDYEGPACLKLVHADVEAYVATQRVNRDHEVDVDSFIAGVYRPPDEKKAIEVVNDGLNRQLRGHRPPRERPPREEAPRYENYWQARYMMEALGEAVAQVENSNGGQVKPSKIFKRLDFDNDGYISISDLCSACERYKVPTSGADLHALFSELDPTDRGSVDIGEFTRNYEVHAGSLIDSMARPIRAVYHEGGVEYSGPVQDKLDARERALEERHAANAAAAGARSSSAPPSTAASARSQMSRAGASIAGSTGSSIPTIQETGFLSGKTRVSDAIRARCSMWKPHKSELHTSLPKTRFGMTVYADTRHVTEANVPLSHSYLSEADRFRTTNAAHSIYAAPDPRHPQTEDAMKRHARSEFRVERIRQRQHDFSERCLAANEAARSFDEMKIARKAMNQLNYERKCHMSCC